MRSGDAMHAERRRETRRRVLMRGRIVFSGGRNVVECVLSDLSGHGARLRTSALQPLPERFELRIDRTEVREVEVRYRTMDATGVEFVAAAA